MNSLIVKCWPIDKDYNQLESTHDQNFAGILYLYEDSSYKVCWARNPKRIDDFCDKLRALWKTQPDLRFGQIVNTKDIYYKEDGEVLKEIIKFFEEVNK